jgi:hypothetical protein
MRPPRPTHAAAALLLAFSLVAGCGGSMNEAAQPSSGAPAREEAPLPDTIDGTLARLDGAEAELARLYGPAPAYAYAQPPGQYAVNQGGLGAPPQPQAQPLVPAPTATAAQPAPQAEARKAEAQAATDSAAPTDDPCMTACRALASMRRAANHLCDLTGSNDPRCASAQDRVTNAGGRVQQHCTCNG